VGAELNVPFLQEQQFRNTVSLIRNVFQGKLTVAVLWIQMGNLPLPENYKNKINKNNKINNNEINSDDNNGIIYSGKESKMLGWPELQWYDAIDIIGVDGYFELNVSAVTAPVDALVQAWQPVIQELLVTQKKWNKSIIFTEIGYTSSYQSHLHPAQMDLIAYDDCSVWTLCVNLIEQANCYESLFQALYPLDWFLGVHWWIMRTDPEDGGTSDPGFGFVNKPSEDIIREYYAK